MAPGSTLRPHGGYRRLRSFQVAEIVYDATVSFCDRFVDKRSRTHDQMVQAARSGRQNIAEGEPRVDGVEPDGIAPHQHSRARAWDELLLDYEDFLRHRKLPLWDKDGGEAQAVRAVGSRNPDRTDRTDRSDYSRWLDSGDAAVVANATICLIHQANYLLDIQLRALEREFIDHGGYSERLAAARLEKRLADRTDQSDRTDRNGNGSNVAGLRQVRQADGAAHGAAGKERGLSVLGLLGLSGVQGKL
jgi:four helix bundle suffix protein